MFQEYAESAMNELLGWYGYCNNNEHSSDQTNIMTNNKVSTTNFASMSSSVGKRAVIQVSSTCLGGSNSDGKRETSSSLDEIESTNIDSMSSTDDSTKMTPNIITKETISKNASVEKPQSGKLIEKTK